MSLNKSQEIDASLVEGFNNLRVRNDGNHDNNNRQHHNHHHHHRIIYNSNNNNYRRTMNYFNSNRYRQQRNFQRNQQQQRQQQQQQQQHYQSRRQTYSSEVAGTEKYSADQQQQHQPTSATEATVRATQPTAALRANASTDTAPRMQVNQVVARLPPPPRTEPNPRPLRTSYPQSYCMQPAFPGVASRPTQAAAPPTPSTTLMASQQQQLRTMNPIQHYQQEQQQQLPPVSMPSENQRSAAVRIFDSEPSQLQRLHESQMLQTLPIEEAIQQMINTPTAEFYVVATSLEEVTIAIATLLAHDFHVDVFDTTAPETSFEDVPRGLTATQIDELASSKYNPDTHDGTQNSCVVCMCEFELDQVLHKLPCSHEFHAECVGKWLKTHRTCPVCRHELFEETDEIW